MSIAATAPDRALFYAKHLRRRDLTMLRFLLTDLIGSARARRGALIRWRAELAIAPRARLAGLPGRHHSWLAARFFRVF